MDYNDYNEKQWGIEKEREYIYILDDSLLIIKPNTQPINNQMNK